MSFLNIFTIKRACDQCQRMYTSRDLCHYDASFDDKRPTRPADINLCRECLTPILEEDIRSFNGKAVVFYPLKEYENYYFYPFSILKDVDYPRTDFQVLQDVLKKAETCACKEKAQYIWCSPEAYENNYKYKLNLLPDHYQYYCRHCLPSKFSEKIETDGITFREIYPPRQGDGIWLSM